MANLPYKYRSSRFPFGLTNVDPRHPLASLSIPDQTKGHIYQNDFDAFASADWTSTAVGAGSNALVAGDGGLLLLTTGVNAADSRLLTKLPAAFTLVAGYRCWFRMKCQLSDATNTQFIAGVVNAITTYTPTDGIFFSKADTATAIVGNVSSGSVNVATALPAAVIAADATDMILGMVYDGDGTVEFFFNDVRVASASSITLPTGNLTMAFGVKSGAAAGAKTLSVDYIQAGKQRADLVIQL